MLLMPILLLPGLSTVEVIILQDGPPRVHEIKPQKWLQVSRYFYDGLWYIYQPYVYHIYIYIYMYIYISSVHGFGKPTFTLVWGSPQGTSIPCIPWCPNVSSKFVNQRRSSSIYNSHSSTILKLDKHLRQLKFQLNAFTSFCQLFNSYMKPTYFPMVKTRFFFHGFPIGHSAFPVVFSHGFLLTNWSSVSEPAGDEPSGGTLDRHDDLWHPRSRGMLSEGRFWGACYINVEDMTYMTYSYIYMTIMLWEIK